MKNLTPRSLVITVVSVILLLQNGPTPVSAQEANQKKWHFLAQPYLMFPYMDGETGIGENLILPVDATAGDIFSNLQMGAMIYLEAQTEKWTITSDIVYMKLNQDVTPGIIVSQGNVTVKQFIWEATGLYRLTPWLELGVGGRLNYLQTSVDLLINLIPEGTEEATGRQHKTWYDPILVTRFKTDINNKWLFQARGDLGGFGVGSKFTWQAQGYVGYRFNKLFQLTGGYRIISIDYSSGEPPKDFVFNMKEFGPVIQFGFNF